MNTRRAKALCALVAVVVVAVAGLAAGAARAEGEKYETFKQAWGTGYAKFQTRKYAEARADMQAAVALAKTGVKQAQAQMQIGHCYFRERAYAEAQKAYGKVLAIEGASPHQRSDAQSRIAYSLYYGAPAKPETRAAVREEFGKVLKMEGAHPAHQDAALMMIGDIYRGDRKHAAALEVYAKLLQKPNQSRAQYYTAYCHLAMKEYDKALAGYGKVLEMKKVHPHFTSGAHLQRGHLLRRAKDFAGARAEYEKVLSVAKGRPQHWHGAQLHIGVCFMEEKDNEQARAAFEKVLKMEKVHSSFVKRAQKYLDGLGKAAGK